MGTNFQKLYKERRKEKEQQKKEEKRVSKPVTKENDAATKRAIPTQRKAHNQQPLEDPLKSSSETETPPLDLLRAKDALGKIDALKAESLKGHGYGNYVSYVKGLPATVLQNGLGQAMATLLAGAKLAADKRGDDEKAREKLYNQIRDWLCRDDEDAPYRGQSDLMHAIVNGEDEDSYLRAQAETMAHLRWLKKFAVAFLEKKEND